MSLNNLYPGTLYPYKDKPSNQLRGVCECAADKHQSSWRSFTFCVFQQRIEIHKLRDGDNLILGFSIGGGIDQDPSQNPFSEDKTDKVKV